MKAVVAAFNQEKALVGAFSVITNLRITFDPTTIAYRSTGSVPVPLRKGSNPAQNTYNKNNKGEQKLHVAGVNMTIK